MSLLYPKTDTGILLISAPGDDGVIRILNQGQLGITLGFEPKIPVMTKALELLLPTLGKEFVTHIKVEHDFYEELQMGEKRVSLYLLAAPSQKASSLGEWVTLPALIAALPKDRTRVVMLKAWQFLLGVHKEELAALESKDLHPQDGI